MAPWFEIVDTFPQHGELPELLISRAEEALYAAKQQGRNTVVTYAGRSIP